MPRSPNLPAGSFVWPPGALQSISLTDDGLVMGAGSLLLRMSKALDGTSKLEIDADRDRLDALLAVAGNQQMSVEAYGQIEAAARDWQRGEKALANLRLVFADLPMLAEPADVYRLSLAEYLLDNGLSPAELTRELGLKRPRSSVRKYSPNQPRVPAGHGRESGRFSSGTGTGGDSSEAFIAPIGPSFLLGASADSIEDLAVFAARFATPTAVLGALLIPTPNSGGVVDGTLTGALDIAFHKDGPEGRLRLTTKAQDGSDVVVVAQSQHGLYVDVSTGQPIGRDLGSSLYFDAAAVRAAIDIELAAHGKNEPDRNPKAAIDEPQLCPAPEKDTPHGASERALDYEEDVHERVNPAAPLERGFAVRVTDPATGKPIYFDDCFRTHGDLIDGDMKPGDLVEAKGLPFERLLSTPFGGRLMDDFVETAQKQQRAAQARGAGLKWYFAEEGAANAVRSRFSYEPGLESIVVKHMPPRKGK